MINSQSGEYIYCSDLLQNPQMSNLKVPGNVNAGDTRLVCDILKDKPSMNCDKLVELYSMRLQQLINWASCKVSSRASRLILSRFSTVCRKSSSLCL